MQQQKQSMNMGVHVITILFPFLTDRLFAEYVIMLVYLADNVYDIVTY